MRKFVHIFLLINSFILALPLKVGAATPVYQAEIKAFETKGLYIQVLPETILDTELSLSGDFFSAFLSPSACNIFKVPERTRLLGQITKLDRPKTFSRDARINVHINELMFPDGSTMKVSADFSSKESMQEDEKPNDVKALARKLIKHGSRVTASTLVGAVDAVQYGGLSTAIMTYGIVPASGAAIGLGLGLSGVVKGKGEELVSSGFEPINLKLDSEFVFLEEIPILAQELEPIHAKLLGIDIKVKQISKYKSQSYGDFVLVDIELANNSPKDLFLGDFVLSSNRHILPILNNPLIANDGFSSITVKNSRELQLAFSLGSMKRSDKYQLMLLNPVTQEIVANADIDISSYL